MKNQVLSIEQMQKLKGLGVDTSKASMAYISKYPSCDFNDGDQTVVVSKDFNKRLYNEFGPAFTLQDIIELLPKSISTINGKNWLAMDVNSELTEYIFIYVDINNSESISFSSENIIHAAYRMLIWVAEIGYLKTE